VNSFDKVLQPHETYATVGNNANDWLLYVGNAWNSNGTLGYLSEGYGPGVSWGNMTWANTNYQYDNANRLSGATDSHWFRNFGYDAYGNMSVTGNYNVPLNGLTPVNLGNNPYNPANNRLLEASYDAAGNMSGVGALSFWYDAEGRQTQSYDSGSQTRVYYTYDGAGYRIQKTIAGGATTVFVYDALGTLAAEYASTAITPACVTCYLSYDLLGSVRLVTDQSANVVSRHDYLPYGEEIPNGSGGRSGNQFGAASTLNQKFTGQERDPEMTPNVDFFNARHFSGVLGSFTRPDPANAGADLYNPQSWNGYGYVLGNPLNGVDSSGMSWLGDLWDRISGWFGGSLRDPEVPVWSEDPDTDSVDSGIPIFYAWSYYRPPSRQKGGAKGGNQPPKNVVNASQALATLLSKINSLKKPCSSILPSRRTLRAKANQLSFWDARVNGSIPVSLVPGSTPSVPGATISSEVANSYAVTLYGPNHSISSNVVLGGAFFTQSYSAQQTTLLHEDLHYTLQKNDQQVVQKYNILPGPFDSFSSAFNRWLINNCQ